MTTLLLGISFSQDARVNSVKRMAVAVPVGRVSNFATEDSLEEWQNWLRSLQLLICELLVKNQQLSWALMEMKEPELRDDEDRKR